MADIARLSGLDRSSTQRLVYTLEVLGYVQRIAETKTYGLTSKVLQFSLNYLRANELVERASPYLLEMSRTLGETTNLHELTGHDIVFVGRFPGQHLINLDIVVGARLPALFTASGTAILSQLSEDEREAIMSTTPLERITPFTETNVGALRERIQKAEERGYSVVMNETVMGDISVASAITNEYGIAVAAINISVPTTRWTAERVESELAQHVQVAATAISRKK